MAALGILFLAPSAATADGYWRNHWGWYDNTYRPYYNTYYGPGYYGYGGGYYAPQYYGGAYYSGPYYNGYYAAPGPYYAPGVGVRVGRMNFGWW